MNKFIQTKYLNVFFATIIVLILAAAVINYRQMDKVLTAHAWVTHTYKVIEENETVLAKILDLESTTRGFLISGNQSFIEDFEQKKTNHFINYENLFNLAKDNPVQTKFLLELKELLEERIKVLTISMALKKEGKIQSAYGNEMISKGQKISAEIQHKNKQIYDAEMNLLDRREDETINSFNNTVYFTIIITVLSIFILISILIVFNNLINKSKKDNDELNKTYTTLQTQTNEMVLINNMDNFLSSSYSLTETMQILASYLKKLLPSSNGILFLMKSSANYLENYCRWGDPILAENIFAPAQCWALRQGTTYSYCDANNSIPCPHNTTITSPPYLCVPLLAQNEIIGLLYIEAATKQTTQNSSDILAHYQQVLQNISGQIAMSISNIRLHEVLKTRSTRDPLTNLYNRAYLLDTLERDLERAKFQNIPIGVVMLDLDHFKAINDKYGHATGDQVLQKIANLISENIEQGDIISRYGGEEFLLVLYNSDTESALKRTEELRKRIAELEFFSDVGTFNVSASFGVAMFPAQFSEDKDILQQLLKASDAALLNLNMLGEIASHYIQEKCMFKVKFKYLFMIGLILNNTSIFSAAGTVPITTTNKPVTATEMPPLTDPEEVVPHGSVPVTTTNKPVTPTELPAPDPQEITPVEPGTVPVTTTTHPVPLTELPEPNEPQTTTSPVPITTTTEPVYPAEMPNQ